MTFLTPSALVYLLLAQVSQQPSSTLTMSAREESQMMPVYVLNKHMCE